MLLHGNYFGPGNRVNRGYYRSHHPIDKLDRLAYEHDVAYARYSRRGNPYTHYNDADRVFSKKLRKLKPRSFGVRVKKYAALGYFGLKKLVAPRM
jgi:hypothetical protein